MQINTDMLENEYIAAEASANDANSSYTNHLLAVHKAHVLASLAADAGNNWGAEETRWRRRKDHMARLLEAARLLLHQNPE